MQGAGRSSQLDYFASAVIVLQWLGPYFVVDSSVKAKKIRDCLSYENALIYSCLKKHRQIQVGCVGTLPFYCICVLCLVFFLSLNLLHK